MRRRSRRTHICIFAARPEGGQLLARLFVDAATIGTQELGVQPATSALAVCKMRKLGHRSSVLDGLECCLHVSNLPLLGVVVGSQGREDV